MKKFIIEILEASAFGKCADVEDVAHVIQKEFTTRLYKVRYFMPQNHKPKN